MALTNTEIKKKYNRLHKSENAERHHKYYLLHKDELREKARIYRATHKDKMAEYNKKQKPYRQVHKTEKVEYDKKYKIEHKDEIKIKGKARYQKDKVKHKAKNKMYNDTHKAENSIRRKKYQLTHKAEVYASRQAHKTQLLEYKIGLKRDALTHYGNGKCACVKCGYSENIDGLQLDHINGNGAQHRRSINRATIYLWLKKKNYPEGYQTLCGTCHLIKTIIDMRNGKTKRRGNNRQLQVIAPTCKELMVVI